MLDLRPVLYALGALITLLGASMMVPALVDAVVGSVDWQTFVIAGSITLVIGLNLILAYQQTGSMTNLRQAFLLTILVWTVLPVFAALPLAFSELDLSFTDAYFEAMSGLTTTGSTVITGLDVAPPGILLWRGLLQWFGGLGIVVMAIAILPMLQVGGMQLFMSESFDTSENMLPRARQLSDTLGKIYIALTALCALLLLIAGMSPLEATVHAMTTIATGGFSTSDGSVGHFNSAAIDFIVIFFMLLGSIPFLLYFQLIRGKPIAIWQDEQARSFLKVVFFLVVALCFWLMTWKEYSFFEALRYGGFNIISIMTGTGYATMDYGEWGNFSVTLFFMVMFIGGCAGSTSCGIKIFRFQVLFKNMRCWIDSSLQPNGVFVPTYNGREIHSDVTSSVMSFLAFFLFSFIVLAGALSLTGLDWITAFSSAGTAIANVGPGLGDIVGPAGTFQTLPDSAKWMMSFGMLLGRLELFSIFVLLSKGFWRG